MQKYQVIESDGQIYYFKSLRDVSISYKLSYSLTCRIYRNDYHGTKKNHQSIQKIRDSIKIIDYTPILRERLEGK